MTTIPDDQLDDPRRAVLQSFPGAARDLLEISTLRPAPCNCVGFALGLVGKTIWPVVRHELSALEGEVCGRAERFYRRWS